MSRRKHRAGGYIVASLALVAIAATPLAGSAAGLANSPFGVKALNTDGSGKYAIKGLKLGGGTPGDSESTTTPTPTPEPVDPATMRTILTVDTSLTGCTVRNLKFSVPAGSDYFAPNAIVDWGDDSKESVVVGTNSHTYAKAQSYKVTIEGKIPGLTGPGSGSSTVANCVTSIDQFGSASGIRTLSSLFQNSSVIKSVAAPPSTVTDLSSMFAGASKFNGDISGWDTSNVTTMSGMFNGARVFAGDLSKWNTGNVNSMYAMFTNTSAFNSPVNSWNVSKVTDMRYMFQYASGFDQAVDQWDTRNVVGMLAMFQGASKMSYGMRFWNVDKVNSWQNFYAGTLLKSTQVPQKFL